MNGFKTIVAMVVTGIITPKLVKMGLPALSPDDQAELIAAIVAGVGVIFRAFTNSPIFSSLRDYLANKASAKPNTITAISPDVLTAIALATVQELKKQQEKTP